MATIGNRSSNQKKSSEKQFMLKGKESVAEKARKNTQEHLMA